MKKAVILLNMGGPNSLFEVKVFLKNMFNDPAILGIKNDFLRSVLANFITFMRTKEATQNYSKLGGKSPINAITASLVNRLNALKDGYVYDYAMNYTPPFIEQILNKYLEFDEIKILPLYPHDSITTTHSSILSAQKAAKNAGFKNLTICDRFYESDEYNHILINLITTCANLMSKEEIKRTTLIFSAHSLPQKLIDGGDLYETHINAQVKILSNLLDNEGVKFKDIKLAYQSRIGPIKWLEPNIKDVLKNLEIKRALILPIAFCIDNSETDFELSKMYASLADELGFEYYNVCKCPNDSDSFVKFISNFVSLSKT